MSRKVREAAEWRKAATDLGFAFTEPFSLEHAGGIVSYVGMLPDFGGGMLVIFDESHDAEVKCMEAAQACGYGFSCVEIGSYDPDLREDRAAMIKMLHDWTWTGPEKRTPAWYLRRIKSRRRQRRP